ncbi:IS200/IS605 family transposase [Pseudogracilibacillus sp. SO30301A]|uniref:IS200/IS605 family transposase n=1 Tax=Pseudogracilibacillus sp. SO30301A TaxID=3098291 RepID=UPI00300E6C26
MQPRKLFVVKGETIRGGSSLLFDAPPQINLANTVNSFKTVTSRYIRKEFEKFLQTYYWKPYFWSRSYLILTSGEAPISVTKEYIKNQDREG